MGDRSRFIPGGCACGTMLKRMEPVSGRYSGFISAGDAVLHLPDFDEALFPIPGLLNFSVSVAEDFGKPSLAIEVHMLTPVNISTQVREALESIPSMGNLELDVICRYNPDEAGSLIKRVIVDKRGFHA
jgi:phenylacetate-coenzyme A ligase PaaK-like adenylate-forming protein